MDIRELEKHISAYDIDVDSLKHVGGFMSEVYEYRKNGRDYILKVIDSSRRSVDNLMGEVEWLRYLSDRGLSVARAVPFTGEKYIDSYRDKWLLSYVKAGGRELGVEEWNDGTFYAWGVFMGKMHRLTKKFQPTRSEYIRQDFFTEEIDQYRQEYETSPAEIRAFTDHLLQRIESLPKTNSSYGLVHCDFHSGNFHIAAGEITLFDFDDIAYSWFANDIAITLYYSLILPPTDASDLDQFAHQFLRSFLRGYQTEIHFEPIWYTWMQDFIDFAQVHVYWIIQRNWDLQNLHGRQARFYAKLLNNLTHHRSLVTLR